MRLAIRDLLHLGACCILILNVRAELVPIPVVTNSPVRIMTAHLTGNSQRYEPFATRIFQGLKPDIVAIQGFNVGSNTPAEVRQFVDEAFGPDFQYFQGAASSNPTKRTPNGIISRWQIKAFGQWPDPQVSNRLFAWAQLNIPGPDDLYVASVLLDSNDGGGPISRKQQADFIKAQAAANFRAGAYVVMAGDFNFDSRDEAALRVFKTFLLDDPVPTDAQGDPDTNNGRSKSHDYVLTSANWRTNLVPTQLSPSGQSFANGLVFDSRVYSPLSEVAPVQSADSGNAQHMAVVKDFVVRHTVTNLVEVTPPKLEWSGPLLRWTSPAQLSWRVEITTNFVQWIPLGRAESASTAYSYKPPMDLPGTTLLRVVYP